MSNDATNRVADALRRVANKLDVAFQSGELGRIDASQLAETFLLIAEELDPPLPKPAAVRTPGYNG